MDVCFTYVCAFTNVTKELFKNASMWMYTNEDLPNICKQDIRLEMHELEDKVQRKLLCLLAWRHENPGFDITTDFDENVISESFASIFCF